MLTKKIGPTLVCCFSPNQGGMELTAFELTKLLEPVAEVSLVCRTNTYIHKQSSDHGVASIKTIDFKGSFSLKFIREFRAILEETKSKNIIFLGASELKSLYFACRNRDVNFVNVHGTTKTHSKKDFFHRLIYKVVDTHVTVSDHIQRNVKQIIPFSNHTKIKTIYLPKEIKKDLVQKPTGAFNCLLAGRIAGGKGHLDAIKACEHALDKGFDVNLTFAGNYEDNAVLVELKNYLSNSPMKSRCNFTGHLSDLSETYMRSHILLFPSWGEGLGAVILESFQYGVLPVTYDNTVFPEFLRLGFQFPQAQDRNIKSLSDTFVSALTKYPNSNGSIRHNFNLAKKIFSEDNVRSQYETILK